MGKRRRAEGTIVYRFLKIIWSLGLLCSVALLFLTNSYYDISFWDVNENRSTLTCNENWQTDQVREFTFDEIGFWPSFEGEFIYEDYFKSFFSEENDTSYTFSDILGVCFPEISSENRYVSYEYAYTLQYIYELVYSDGLDFETAKAVNSGNLQRDSEFDHSEYVDFTSSIFLLDIKRRFISGLWPYIWKLLLIGVIFEILRRIFYYVVFGSFYFSDYQNLLNRVVKTFSTSKDS